MEFSREVIRLYAPSDFMNPPDAGILMLLRIGAPKDYIDTEIRNLRRNPTRYLPASESQIDFAAKQVGGNEILEAKLADLAML